MSQGDHRMPKNSDSNQPGRGSPGNWLVIVIVAMFALLVLIVSATINGNGEYAAGSRVLSENSH